MFCFFFTPVLRLGLRFGIQITTNAHTNLRNDNGNNKNIQRERVREEERMHGSGWRMHTTNQCPKESGRDSE